MRRRVSWSFLYGTFLKVYMCMVCVVGVDCRKDKAED